MTENQNQNQNNQQNNSNTNNSANTQQDGTNADNNQANQQNQNNPAQTKPLTRFIGDTTAQLQADQVSTIDIRVQQTPEYKALEKELKQLKNEIKGQLVTELEQAKIFKKEELEAMTPEELSIAKKFLEKQKELSGSNSPNNNFPNRSGSGSNSPEKKGRYTWDHKENKVIYQ